MKVRATDRGVHGGRLREVGEEFDYQPNSKSPKDYFPSWMEKVEPEKGGRQSAGKDGAE